MNLRRCMAERALVRDHRRLRLHLTGAVQGVGFRPFLFRAATDARLSGWIRNDTRGVMLEVEGPEPDLAGFRDRVRSDLPPRAVLREIREEWLPATGLRGLTILPSTPVGERETAVLPDLATCDACLADIGLRDSPSDGRDRRHGYAFTNCTDCGPRFSIIRSLPYDRPNTTMAAFALCPECRAEYEDPRDRRFHAQPTACPACGPQLRLTGPCREAAPASTTTDVRGGEADGSDPVAVAAAALRAGRIVALKGLGGFHLMVDAADGAAVARLRARKRRPTKPLAVMVRDLDMARRVCTISPTAEALLVQPEAPIVLVPRRPDAPVADAVAPGNPCLGIMLPYTPLHHLLMRAVGRAVVATSGNVRDEPICTDETEARVRLGHIADLFLVHDRPIERPVDDSVVQIVSGEPQPIRRSRGYAPLPVSLPGRVPVILAVGGHLKSTVALARGSDVFLSQHIGDLETPEARRALGRVIEDFLRLYDVTPELIAHDLHPDYASTAWAVEAASGRSGGPASGSLAGTPRIPVQHHHAHLAACLAENGVDRALGVVWDGTGWSPDGTVWGGEFLVGGAAGYRRVAHLRPFRLPGGDAAIREPRRMALALADAAWGVDGIERARARLGADAFTDTEVSVLARMLRSGLRSPWTTSAGRLFDGVSALCGLRQRVDFEGEAAMALEFAVDPDETGAYAFPLVGPAGNPEGEEGEGATLILDWVPALDELLADLAGGTPVPVAAARFHNGLVQAIRSVAERVGEPAVALTGGVFQNRMLTERTTESLGAAGLRPLLHRRVPPNDGGLALGQVAVAAATHEGAAR